MAVERGTMPLHKLLQPAIKLAREGFVMNPFQTATCRLLTPIYTATPSMRDVFFKNNQFIEEGDRLLVPNLVETLERLGEMGAAEMRAGGRIGRNLTQEQAKNGGLVTAVDLDAYRVLQQPALRVAYRDCDVLLPPPCSVGGVLIAFTLKLLREFDVAALGINSAESQALLFNAMQLTNQARHELDGAVFYGSFDEFVQIFLSADYMRFYQKLLLQAMGKMRPISADPTLATHPNTSHLSVLDGNGLAVGITTTAGESAGHIVPNTGFIPNNMLGEADLNPLGWHRWQAGERMPTMMSPLIVLREGNVRLVSGSGGSERIRSALLQTIINTIDHQLPLEQAINLPRVHAERDTVQLEFGQETGEQLAAWGFSINQWR
jgi:gamma-glutamyltranspeptidase/glutathione hydrolase